jgi:hypothetical protein
MNQDALFRAFRSGYGIDYRETVQDSGIADAGDRGRYDAFCDLDDMRAMAEAIPGARFDVIEACGHMATIEQLRGVQRGLAGWFLKLRGWRHEASDWSPAPRPSPVCRTTRRPTFSGASTGPRSAA